MTNTTSLSTPSRGTLKIIAGGLEEIGAHLGWEAITGVEDTSGGVDVLPPEDGGGEEVDSENDDEPYEETFYTAGFDREEVEIAIDAFLSHLLRKRLIRKNKSGRLPSFSGVFEKFFGEEHQISKVANNFETNVAGYFGWIDYANMDLARDEFLEIQAFIKKELENSGGV